MRIALLVPSIAVDATIATPALALVARTIARHHELHVLALRSPGPPRVVARDGYVVETLGTSGARFRDLARATLGALAREHRRAPFDLLHAVWLHEPGTLAVVGGLRLRLPVVASIGGGELVALPAIGYGGLRTRRGRLVARIVARQARIVTGGSRAVLDQLASATGRRSDVARLPLPVDVTTFTPEERADSECAPRLFHAASLIPVKDQATLLRAFQRVRQTCPAARIDVAGEDPFGQRATLERLASELGIADRVRFLGALPHETLVAHYRRADVFLLSSLHESQALVVLEAAACGLPTVGTAVGVVPDLAPDAAIAVPVGDAAALADATLALLRDPARRRAMGAAARQAAVAHYAPEPVLATLDGIYRAASRGRR